VFVTIQGETGSGFHRHIWDTKTMSREDSKMARPKFQPTSVEEFILQGFALLGVTYRKGTSNGIQMSIA
jgi:hypothetical protein